MFNESRPISVYADATEIATDNRILARGRYNMTLLPDFFLIDIYNLSDEDYAVLSRAKNLSVYVDQYSLICTGKIDGLYNHDVNNNRVTSISVNDGMDFWTTSVNTAIGRGSFMKDALIKIIGDNKLGAFMAEDVRLTRGQSFVGGIMDYINDIAKSVNARAFITKGVLFVVEKGRIINNYTLYDDNVITNPSKAGEAVIIKTVVSGYSVGGIINYNNVQYRIIAQTINLDNMSGEWSTEMILIDESKIKSEEMGGGW